MADLFTLFDGSMGGGGAASVSRQSSDSFSAVSSENDLVATLASGSDSVELLIDYSDFANFVTFNSAESYVTVTADQVLNSYPRDGTADDIQVFVNSLDGYQRHFLSLWPSRTGHLRVDRAVSGTYVRVDDFGIQDGTARTSFVSPGTGSLSIQGWIDTPALTGSSAASFVFQKVRPDNSDGCSVYVSGSALFFTVVSGSSSGTASGTLTAMPMFFAAVLDRSSTTGSVLVYTATTGTYPTLASTSSIVLGPRFDLASGSFYIASGSLAAKSPVPFSGSLDSLSVWSTARSLVDLSGTYNRRIHAQSGLLGLWDFNDATPATPASYASIARDGSGHRLDGRIQLFHSGVLGSGSLVFDSPDPILSLDDPDVVSYVVTAQVSGALYDRDNQSLIFRLFPEAFTQADRTSAEVFQNFALILARHFDRIKAYVNQLANLRHVHYGDFDQSPDELLEDVARSFGWELGGGFATTDALRFFIGRGVRPGPQGNNANVLSDVRAAFWRRVLLNLMYFYKTKGTRESVEALLRVYGVDNGFVRLKEYARKTEGTLPLNRVVAEKSVYALAFSSGSRVGYPSTDVNAFLALTGAYYPITTVARYRYPGTVGNGFTLGVQLSPSNDLFTETAAGVQWKYNGTSNTLAQFEAHFPSRYALIASASVNGPSTVINLLTDPTQSFVSGASLGSTMFPTGSDYSVEFRVRFPLIDDDNLTPTELSGALWTLSSGSSFVSAWYEKSSVSSTTGNIYVTSSTGRLTVPSVPIFDDRFYNVSYTRDRSSNQAATLSVMRHEDGELAFSASATINSSSAQTDFRRFDLGNMLVPSRGQFWGQEARVWTAELSQSELEAHSLHFESYGRAVSYNNADLLIHWRLADGSPADSTGGFTVIDSTLNHFDGTAYQFTPGIVGFQKFLEDYAYIPSMDYGWNQEKVRAFSGSHIDPLDAYHDERFVSLEFNMYDALNEDISHIMTSYDELTRMIGMPVNRYREDYEGLRQMRETYFKRLQGRLNFRVFVDMLDFFDSSFSSIVERLLPARSSFRGDEMIVESHMLERPKYQYQLRPVIEGRIEISGSIAVVDRGDDFD